ncbi:MFS transporter, partial [Streptomyces nanshensis]
DIPGLGWRAIFAINVPIVSAALPAVRRVPATAADHRPGFDPLGTLLLGAGMICLLVVVVEGREPGRPLWLWSLLAVAAGAAVALVRVERSL